LTDRRWLSPLAILFSPLADNSPFDTYIFKVNVDIKYRSLGKFSILSVEFKPNVSKLEKRKAVIAE
jgi:hypothetical protein